jgi:hypothetical protein
MSVCSTCGLSRLFVWVGTGAMLAVTRPASILSPARMLAGHNPTSPTRLTETFARIRLLSFESGHPVDANTWSYLCNSRRWVVTGDKRSKGNRWGHVAAPTPSVAGDSFTRASMTFDKGRLDAHTITGLICIGDEGNCSDRWCGLCG